MTDIELIEETIEMLSSKLNTNSRKQIQSGIGFLFSTPESWKIRSIPGLSSRSFKTFRDFVFGETPWGLGWTYKVAEAFILPEKPEIWKEIEANVQPVNPNGGDKISSIIYNTGNTNEKQGTSREYSISVLKRDAPEIAQRVIDREISAAEGMRLAGKKEPTITCKATVNGFYNAIKRKLTQDQITELKQML